MQDKTVYVKYTVGDPASWDFSENPIVMKAPGKIMLERDPTSSGFGLSGAIGLPEDTFKIKVKKDGSRITIDDTMKQPNGGWSFQLVVTSDDESQYVSPMVKSERPLGPPPIIMNDGT